MRESSKHIKESNALADSKQMRHLNSDRIEKPLDDFVALHHDFVNRVGNSLIELHDL